MTDLNPRKIKLLCTDCVIGPCDVNGVCRRDAQLNPRPDIRKDVGPPEFMAPGVSGGSIIGRPKLK